MAKRKKKIEYTEGVLARDKKKPGYILFFTAWADSGIPRRRDVQLDPGGFWGESREVLDYSLWEEQDWLKHYNRSDMPRRGSAFECELEL